jgi:ATP-dependent DNA helicase RecG
MLEQELKSIVRGREKRTLEYKRAWAEVPNSLYDTICAFLNRDGGVIVLGAENDGSIPQGVNPNTIDQMCKNISNMSNNPQIIVPTFLLQPEIVQVDDKKVIVISVPSSSQVHRVKGKVFDRSTDGDFELRTDAEISALYLRKSTQYTENTIYPYLRMEHLQSETIEKAKNLIRNTRSDHPVETF